MDLLKQSSSTILFFYSLENEVFAIFSKNSWIYFQKDVEYIKIFDIMINIYLGGVRMNYIFEVLPSLLNGALVTLQVFVLVLVLSIPLGIVISFLMQIHFKLLHWLINIYIWIMRGTPLLLQLIFIYYVLPSIGVRLDRLPAAIIAFTLNYAAYFAEIFRGGILSIPAGQYEAAKVLKFTPFQTIRFIILPQVIKVVLPSVFNEVMTLVKDTSLVYALGVSDLILASRTAANRDASLAPMFIAGAIYLILIGLVTIVSKQVEKRYSYYK